MYSNPYSPQSEVAPKGGARCLQRALRWQLANQRIEGNALHFLRYGCSLLLLLMVVSRLAAVEPIVPPKSAEVECRGVVESFAKGGFQALLTDGQCEWFDTTSVVIASPQEYAGVRHVLLSRASTGKSAFGEIGATVSFSAYQSTLEWEKHPERGRIDLQKLFADLEKTDRGKKLAAPVPTLADLPLHDGPVVVPLAVEREHAATYLAGYQAGWRTMLGVFAKDLGHKRTFKEDLAMGDPHYLEGWYAARDGVEGMVRRLVDTIGSDHTRARLAAAVEAKPVNEPSAGKASGKRP